MTSLKTRTRCPLPTPPNSSRTAIGARARWPDSCRAITLPVALHLAAFIPVKNQSTASTLRQGKNNGGTSQAWTDLSELAQPQP
ncbi:hypothetical protein IAQ61_008103 [Plenodomus lingam]|uniref:uncharacterized protein n=1 Tax=Leptosphaeria maculans TaxID=5022 RepID=UPI00332A4B09|nr:hypothetical protein IAQ61_008103 [Plenodomus lingam]